MVCTSLLVESLLARFAAQRDRLLAMVPARSPDSARYRAVVCVGAERVLRDAINGEVQSTLTQTTRSAQPTPSGFAQPDALGEHPLTSASAGPARMCEALLQAIVRRDELT